MSDTAASVGTVPARVVLVIAGLCFVLALGLLLWAGLPQPSITAFTAEGEPIAPVPGAIAPLFAARSAEGSVISLADLRGRPVVINFWATWCGPCAVEMPELQRLHDTYGEQITVLGINTGEPVDAVRAWASDWGLSFGLLLDDDGAIAAMYQLRGQPTTFVLGPDGRIRDTLYGPTTFDGLERILRPYLA